MDLHSMKMAHCCDYMMLSNGTMPLRRLYSVESDILTTWDEMLRIMNQIHINHIDVISAINISVNLFVIDNW